MKTTDRNKTTLPYDMKNFKADNKEANERWYRSGETSAIMAAAILAGGAAGIFLWLTNLAL
jgi:hypothetical protein